jgi:molecular chaperone GrpE
MMERKRRIPIGQNGPAETAGGAGGPTDNPAVGTQVPQTASGEAGSPAEEPAAETSVEAGATEAEATIAAERDSYLDSLLRLKAEFENYRKRSQRERDEAESRARGRLLVEFLPILDNLGRALNAAEHHEEGKVLDGVRMTHSQFLSLLEKEGVSEVCPLGEPFDPEVHEAMLTQPSELPEGTITAVLEPGYRTADRVLRPARVAVSTGPGSSGDGAADAARG